MIAHGNLDASIDDSSKDEIGQVARSFKQMMENLKEITSSRDDLNKEVYHRKRAEEDLREEKERLRLSLDAAQAGIWTWDNISGKVSWDEQMHHIFSMAPGTFAGTLDAWRERIHPDDAQDAEKAAIAAMQQGTTFEKEYRVKSSSGEWKIITAHAATLMDENGIPLKMSGFAMDITKRRRAETELLEKHLQLQAILDHAPALISIKDMNGTVILANRNFEVLDIPPLEEFIGKNIFELFPEEVAKSLWENDLKAIETEGPIEAEEVVTHKDGTQHTYLTIKFPLYFENRKPFGICAISTEITERKKLESKLLQAQKMESIGNLAGGIAHDFNNILSAIIGFTELALGEAEKDSTQESDLKEVQAAGNRAKELVKQILAFARKSEEKLKPVRPSDSIENTLKLLGPSTPTSIQIITNINSSSMIMANPSQMEQIVLNLCTNSIHAMQNHGDVLEIGLRDVVLSKNHKLRGAALRSREYIEISVTDTGPGIEPNTIDNIFEPYFTTKEVGEGTGMGLAMVKGTVENWGGEITVKSEPHKKTTFKILLPISTNIDRKTSPQPESYSLGTEHILFVDDEPPIARMGSRILESLGYTVTVRTSSIEALELFKNKSDEFDLVMSDMTMPFMTGDELSIEIRKIKPNIPIIICTGYSNKLTDEGAKLIGINAFTYKPFTKSDFAKTVRAVLEED